MTIVETSVWIDFLRGTRTRQTGWLMQNMGQPLFRLTDMTLCEVLQGQKTDASFQQALHLLRRVEIHATGGAELAEAAAKDYGILRRKGITIRSTIDCSIATFCLRGEHILLHNDQDFIPFEQHLGLKVVRG